jgi:arabinan endo-1,5-alpha-L-arabinosidase
MSLAILVVGCSSPAATPPEGVEGGLDVLSPLGDAARRIEREATSDGPADAYLAREAAPKPCSTRIAYGASWVHPAGHPAQDDLVPSEVTWGGTCNDDGASSYAELSNGWKPSFTGNGACIIALDYDGACEDVTSACATRITYGSAWLPPASHPAQYDDVSGRVFSDGQCFVMGSDSYADMSNGWQPHFSGSNSCSLSFEYTQCGGLYTTPVIPVDCPDPGVLALGSEYVLTCTSGDAADAFPIYTSPDLGNWTLVGHVFPSGQWPAWAVSDFWAPEVHSVGGRCRDLARVPSG